MTTCAKGWAVRGAALQSDGVPSAYLGKGRNEKLLLASNSARVVAQVFAESHLEKKTKGRGMRYNPVREQYVLKLAYRT